MEATCSDGTAPTAMLNCVRVDNGQVVDLRVANGKSDKSKKSKKS